MYTSTESSTLAARAKKASNPVRLRRSAAIESLEARRLLSVTVYNPIAQQTVPQDTPVTIDVSNAIADSTGAAVTFTASADNVSLLTPTLDGTQLTLTPTTGASGFSHISLTAENANSQVATDRFLVEVTPSTSRTLNVTLGGSSPRSVTYRDAGKVSGAITLSGPGTAVVEFGGDGLALSHPGGHVSGSNAEVMSITLTGTTSASSLKIIGSGGRGGALSIGAITTDGALNSVTMHHAVLYGNLTAPAGLHTVDIDYMTSGTITSGSANGAPPPLTVKNIVWSDVNLSSAAAVQKILTASWFNADNVAESLTAPYVKSIVSSADFSPGLQLTGAGAPDGKSLGTLHVGGYIGGSWSITGNFPNLVAGGAANDFAGLFAQRLNTVHFKGNFLGAIKAPSIGSIKVKGMMEDAFIDVTNAYAAGVNDLSSVSVNSSIINSEIESAGNIGSITGELLNNSVIYAGVGTIASGALLPAVTSDFSAAATIAVVALHPKPKDTGITASYIAAATLGSMALGSVAVGNSGTPFGLAAGNIRSLTGRDPLHKQSFAFNNLTSEAQTTADISAQHLSLEDFAIQLVN